MTTERPDAPDVTRSRLDAVPTPRSGVPTVGFGVSAIAAPAAPLEVTRPEEPKRRSRAVTVAAALLAVVALVGAVVTFRIVLPSTPSAEAADVAVGRADDEEIREQPGTVVRFGDGHSYGDGLELAVNLPLRYEPSTNATGTEDGTPVRVQIVITNRTDTAFRPNTLIASATSAGQEAMAIWDPDQGIALTGPDVSIPAGATVNFYLAFAVADPADVSVEVVPALFGYGATVARHG